MTTFVDDVRLQHHPLDRTCGGRSDLPGLPPAYIEVGELDIFRDEDLVYAQRLAAAGVSTKLHVHPTVPHAWEALVPMAELSQRSAADRHRVISII